MEKQNIIDFLKVICPVGKVEFNNLDTAIDFDTALSTETDIYFLASVENKDKRNADDDIIFKNYFCVDFDIRANYKKLSDEIISDENMELFLEFIKNKLEINGYGDRRYITFTGNGYHFYRVGNGRRFGKEEYRDGVEYHFETIDKILDDKYIAPDKSIKNIGRILRLPGTKNYKRKKYGLDPAECIIVEDSGKISDKIENLGEISMKNKVKEKINNTMKDVFDPVLDAILEIDIIPLVEKYTSLKIGKDNKNFPDKEGNTGMFVADNILYRVGTSRIHDTNAGYNTFMFVKEHYGLDNKGTFERFKSEYNHLNDISKAKKTETPDEIVVDFETKSPFSYGLPIIDRRFGKYDIGKFNVIVGESLSGKTEWTFFQARENAKKNRVLYISLEMSPQDMIIRYAMKRAGVSQEQRSEKTLQEQQKEVMKSKIREVQKIEKLKIIGLESPTMEDISKTIKEYYTKGYTLFYIDNLGFIVGEGEEISYTKDISRKMKTLTNTLPITINLIHHFNKGTTKSREKARGLVDLRSSGKIENDADNIISVNRDLSPDEDNTPESRAEVRISLLKDRTFGSPSSVMIYFHKGEYIEQNPFNGL